ncbi:MAG: hypothetical protein IPP72_17585 [Chitinophagaceae bacterium]|nr:hypothetical protein [Chitinophagaceae bacterium]
MIEAYNFLASWQLFPEKGTYELGNRPKSGTCKIESTGNKKEIHISTNWVTLENQAFNASYTFVADGDEHPFYDKELADSVSATFTDALNFDIVFKRNNTALLTLQHELLPNGFLKIAQHGNRPGGDAYTNT